MELDSMLKLFKDISQLFFFKKVDLFYNIFFLLSLSGTWLFIL